MSASEPTQAAPGAAELESMMRSLSSISGDLVESYERLSARAERVEEELCLSNAALERQVAEVEAILEALPVGVAVRGAGGQLTRVNETLCELLAMTSDDLVGEPAGEVLPGPDRPGEVFSFERCESDVRTLARRTAPIHTHVESDAGCVEVFDDQTELVRLEERLRQLDKMAALGNMAAGIAHEIRNPMNAVKGFADLFKRRMEPGTKDHRWATLISDGVAEVESIISSLLSFARPEKLSLEELDPRTLVDDALAATLQRTPGGLPPETWDIQVACDAGSLRGDRIKLRQALRNLISNALDVQPEGGRLRIDVTERDGMHVFRVDDAGPGVPEELVSRLTDPFFTTRAQGTGLGLSLVQTLVALHGGALLVTTDRSPLGGATFQFTIPSTQLR